MLLNHVDKMQAAYEKKERKKYAGMFNWYFYERATLCRLQYVVQQRCVYSGSASRQVCVYTPV
jgi:hypothetical protein